MKKLLISALIVAALFAAALAEEAPGDFAFDFDSDGYTGEWVSVESLGIEFCLPEGWTAGEDELSFASPDGEIALTLGLRRWAEAGLADRSRESLEDVVEAGMYDALLTATDTRVEVCLLMDSEQLLVFSFQRPDVQALPDAFALQIASSVDEAWTGE